MKHHFIKDSKVFMGMAGINWDDVKSGVDKLPDGTGGTLEAKKTSQPKSSGQLGYYYAVILPMGMQAIRKKQLDEGSSGNEFCHQIVIRGETLELPIDLITTDMLMKWRYSKQYGEFKNKEDMDMAECSQFMGWCIKWLWTHYGCAIPPAGSQDEPK